MTGGSLLNERDKWFIGRINGYAHYAVLGKAGRQQLLESAYQFETVHVYTIETDVEDILKRRVRDLVYLKRSAKWCSN